MISAKYDLPHFALKGTEYKSKKRIKKAKEGKTKKKKSIAKSKILIKS